MRNLTFTRLDCGVQSLFSWHHKFLGALLMLCMCVGFTTDTYAQITLNATLQDVSCETAPCPPDADGDIDLTITGGVAPYDIQWSFNGVDIPTCEEPAFAELDGTGSLDLMDVDNTIVEDAITTRNYVIQGSVLTVNDASFNGGATIDEEIIDSSQGGLNNLGNPIIGLRTGVDHPNIIGGPNAANMIRTFTFDPPVSNLRMLFNDLDNNDVVIVNPKLNGVTQTLTPAEYTIIDPTQVGLTQVDARGNTSPNMFTSLVDQPLNATTTGGVRFVFAGPIDEIEIIFYDDVAEPGEPGSEGGSYTVNFPGQCREDLACIESGTYTVVVTDDNGATATETYVIEPAIGCNPPTQVTIPCGADEGTINVSPAFGVAPYTFGWEDASGNPLPLPDPCTDRNWASFEPLDGVGANPVVGGDNSTVENAINSAPYVIQGAVMTVNNVVFNGGASIDEEIINDTQLNGTFALRTGVDHNQIVGGIGGANMIRTITFSKPVCDLNMFFNDIDNNDVAIINAKLNGVTIPLTPADFTFTGTNVAYVGGNQFESITDTGINNSADGGIDFNFTSCVDEIEIIFYDDVAGPGVAGSEGGSYSINFPPTCDYGPTETLPPGCYNVTIFDANGDSQVVTYCIEQGPCGAIGNYVWIDENADGIQDAGEPGIAGVTVTATNPATGEVLTTTTDANGGYLFDDLVAGKYDILVNTATLPSGLSQTTNPTLAEADFGNQTQAGNGYSITIGDGEENMTGDFGYIWEDPNGNQGTAAIGDRVWYDANSDGVQDPGEAGIGGVTVSILVDADGDGLKDDPFTGAIDQNGNTGTGTTVTEADGSYIFYNLPAGAYSIVVDPNSAPLTGLNQTGDPDDYGTVATAPDNIGESVLLAPGDVYLLMDFGYNDPAANDIGDTIYFDPNADGTQGADEPGIPGVTVALLDQNGDVIATTTTDENGEYLFPGLPDEPYTIVVTDTDNVLGDLVNSGDPDGGNDDTSSVTGLPADDLDQDFGYTPASQDPGEGLVGDTVFLDYNGNGTPDPGEGIEGVTVDLHDGTGAVIASTVTDENGNYYFPGLDPTATYSVTVDPTTLPAGIVPTVDPDGTLDNTSTTDLSADADGIDLTLDFGYEPTPGSEGSIGNLVWLDNNADGVNDGPNGPDGVAGTDDDEPGIEGVTVDLYEDTNGNGLVDAGEPLVASTTTDANGNYLFPNLPTNNGAGVDYIVDVTDEANVLTGYWHSLGAPNTDDNSQTDPYAITLGGGNLVDNLTADFGYYIEPAVLGNYVWMDTNGDGIQDPGEMPIEGAVVTLEVTYPDGSTATLVTTTDANGNYIFENLLVDEDFDGTGTYATPGVGGGDEPYFELSVETPAGKEPTIINVNGNANDAEDSEDPAGTQGIADKGFTDTTPQADPNDEPTHLTYDFGFVAPPELGAIGNYVWVDENGDGIQDPGEPGIAGVTVTATNPVTGDVLTTTTDANGGYIFTDLPAGKYDVLVDETTLPSGMRQSTNPVNPGADFGNQTNNYSITIAEGEENMTGDFGYVWEDPNGNTGTAAIGDRVWLDADSDGVQDPGEAGIGGVTVSIFEDADGDGVKDDPVTTAIDQNGNTGTGVTVTEADGSYIFYGLPAGAYSIVVDGASAPLAGLTQTGDPDDYGVPATNPDNKGESVILAPGDVFLLEDFGYNDPAGNDLGDTVYFDPNANGTQDADEPGIPGVTVALLDENGDVIATTTTDENGEYLFPGLPDEPYTVVVTDTNNVLGGLVNSGDPDGGNDDTSSVTGLPADDLDQDFGYKPSGQDPGEGLIGDTVFLDYNGDGLPDPGEGIEGVTVDLHDGAGVVIATTVTDENGNYYFPGLDPTETYSVTVDPTTLPAGVVPTVDPDGGDDNTSIVDLSADPDGIDLTQDFGYEPTPGSEGSIGNLVWLDNNADGVNDRPNGPDGVAGTDDDEPGIEGVTIDLYEDTNQNGLVDAGEPLVASTTTDANGNYLFPNLPTNNGSGVSYIVDVTDEAAVLGGFWHSEGASSINDNSQTDPYAITLGGGNPVNNLTADFGYYVESAVLGNYVWMDTNGDGIQDPGEMPIEGAVVTLEITYPDGSTATLTTTTDANGNYIFENLLSDEDFDGTGTYATPGVGGGDEPYFNLSVETPAGKTPTIINVNGDANDSEDSEDPAGTQGIADKGFTDTTPQADPNAEPTHLTFDFGFVGESGAIGNLVWVDENGDGIQDPGEPGIAGVTVTATNPVTGDVLTTTTDADGGYLFSDLPPGKYDILVDETTLPAGMSQSTNPVNPGADFGNQTNNYSVTIGAGEENLTADFGYIWADPNGNTGTAAIGDRVWLDANSDGVQDPGEAGIGGVTVSIFEDADGDGIKDDPVLAATDQNGTPGGTTVTEPDGSYIFYNLPAGAYSIVVDGASAPLVGLTQTGDPDDYGAPATNPDNKGESVILAPGDVFLLEDFGYNDPAGNDIGDTVYFDPNANGTQDADEPGIPGVTVALLDENGDVIATTTTDENGEYSFPGLPDEPYTVVVTDTDNVLGDLVNTGDPDGGNDDMASVPGLPADNTDQDFGYAPPGQDPGEGLIGDTVFIDYDESGTPDPGEGIEGVTVDLHDGAGVVIATTVTDENGNYYFPGLDPTETYSVTVDPTTLPAGVVPTVDPDGGDDNTSIVDLSADPDGIDLTQDFGYEPTPGSEGSIGNLVWLDNNADGVNDGPNGPDGVAGTDDDEPGIEGVTIDLYEDTNQNGLVDAGEPLVASTTTDANGNYLFPNLPTNNGAGVDYIVDVTDEADVLAGYWHSLGAPNTNDNSQTDPYAVTLDAANPDDLTADFGYYVEPASLGNRVWEDFIDGAVFGTPTNINGIQDPGELGVPGIPITLMITYPDGQMVTLVSITDANGNYSFDNLLTDEDYTTSGAPGSGLPVYTISAPVSLSVEGPSGVNLDVPSPVDQGGDDFLDSDDHAGVVAIANQGTTDLLTDNANPTTEDPIASYDFGYWSTNLPVELVSFRGIENNCQAILTWVTATETNVSHFSVEQSTNGTDFVAFGRVDAAGESQVERTYIYTDEQLTASNYYRLHIVDFDGSSEYSHTILVTANCATGVSVSDIFPNPVREQLNINVNSNVDHETAKIVVTDNLGRTVMTQATEVFFGSNVINLDVNALPQATYYITIQGENGWFTQPTPFVKVQ